MQTGFRLNPSPVKEPLGFIKLVEWNLLNFILAPHLTSPLMLPNCGKVYSVFSVTAETIFAALFAFACCGGYSGRNVISVFCGNEKNETLNATFSYPFRLNQVMLVKDNATVCNRTMSETHLMGDSSSSVEFFVAVAVLAFLYCMLALLVYVGYMHVYRDSDFGPVFDFLVTAVFAFLWLLCSSAWAQGLQKVKYATGTEGVSSSLLCRHQNATCEVTEFSSMRTLDISVVFGFLNLIIWSGNAWFVYKETCWRTQNRRSQQEAERGRGPGPI